jgi:PAT family beta-lactamase induction signal transducer AmpG
MNIKSFLTPYLDRRMLRILLLGIMSGFPWVLIGSALSLWLKENDLSRTTIGWAGLIFWSICD